MKLFIGFSMLARQKRLTGGPIASISTYPAGPFGGRFLWLAFRPESRPTAARAATIVKNLLIIKG